MRLDGKRYIENYQYMDIEKFALAFKALAHPHRLAIFLRLANCCEKPLRRGRLFPVVRGRIG